MQKNKLLTVLKVIWMVAVIGGVVYYFSNNYSTTSFYVKSIDLSKLFLSSLLLLIVRFFTIDLVKNSLKSIGWKPDFLKAFIFVSISQLGKYIPGGVWQFVARFSSYKENGISIRDTGKAFLVENLWLILGSFLVGVCFVFISLPSDFLKQLGITTSIEIQILIAILSMIIWICVLIIIEKYFRPKGIHFSFRNVIGQFFSQTLMWILYGISFFLLFNRTGTVNDLLYCIGAFSLSFMGGYLVIFAPGGLGVREAIAIMFFSMKFTNSEIGVYAIVHRFLYTIVEFLLAGISFFLIRYQEHIIHDRTNKRNIQGEN